MRRLTDVCVHVLVHVKLVYKLISVQCMAHNIKKIQSYLHIVLLSCCVAVCYMSWYLFKFRKQSGL